MVFFLVSETNEENHDMTSTPPPPEFDTEIYVQQKINETDEFTEGNNLINSKIQTGTPSNTTTSVKEKSPTANDNAKKIFDKRKNNDEEDQHTLGLCEKI